MRRGCFVASALFVHLSTVGRGSADVVGRTAGEPRLDASGFIGLGWFADDIELGNSWAAEQVPGTAPVVGARFAYVVAPALVVRDGVTRLALALEGELSLTTSYTGGSSFEGSRTGRMSYFAPVFGWRAHAALRVGSYGNVTPHVLVGAGGATVASSSPFMSKETDPILYYGPGVSVPLAGRWKLRVDLRHGFMASRLETASTTSVFELQFGVGAVLDPPSRKPRGRVDANVAVDSQRRDRDGSATPKPPIPPPTPKPPSPLKPPGDTDRDGVADTADKCPADPEDRDNHADADGCPDPDNDADQIADPADKCPAEPETRNGFGDDDGCPDDIPAKVTTAFAAVAKLRFEANRARVTPAAEAALQSLFDVLDERRDMRIVIAGHPDKAGNEELAKRRAEAVKWHLVDKGLTEDRIDTVVGAVGSAPISVSLPPAKTAPAPPSAKPAPAPSSSKPSPAPAPSSTK